MAARRMNGKPSLYERGTMTSNAACSATNSAEEQERIIEHIRQGYGKLRAAFTDKQRCITANLPHDVRYISLSDILEGEKKGIMYGYFPETGIVYEYIERGGQQE